MFKDKGFAASSMRDLAETGGDRGSQPVQPH
jgi:hypothetical protein